MRRAHTMAWGLLCTAIVPGALAQGSSNEGDAPSTQAGTATTAPQVTPPVLLHFEPAPYPAEASRDGLEAIVVLRLQIDGTGRVTQVEVTAPAGHGFDEAAVAAAMQFAFDPAVRNGAKVASRILYRYSFTLPQKPKSAPDPEPKSEHDLPQAIVPGELRGVLTAGVPPLPLASVPIRVRPVHAGDDATSTHPATSQMPSGSGEFSLLTDASGAFTAPNLAPGEYWLNIVAEGFTPVQIREHVEPNQVTALKYTLEPLEHNTLEVTVRAGAVHREVTHYELSRDELLRVPGTMGDAIHAVEAMPSVARAPAFSGALIVRGSSPIDTQVFVEGTLVPRVFHYGSLSSVVPSEMIESLEFYPSNFSVRYGRGMGGIVEVGLRQTNPDGKYHGSAQIDFINARVNAEGPVPYLKGWSFMAGARTSYVDRWLVPVLRSSGSAIQGMPRYSDYQMYLERKLPHQGVFRLGFFGATDKYVPIASNPKDWRPPADSFGHVQALLKLPLTSDVHLKASWSLGKTYSVTPGDGDQMNHSTVHLITARSELSARTGTFGIARIGADVLYAPYRVEAETVAAQSGGVLAAAQTDSPNLRRVDLHDVFLRPAAFAEYEFAPSRGTNVTGGVRLDHARDTSEVDVAPRIAARQRLFSNAYSPTIKGGIGLFYQPPQPGQTLPELGTPGLRSERAIHSMLGFEQPLGKQVSVSVEGFEKELRNLINTRVDGSGNAFQENSGKGHVLGLDVLLRYHPDGKFFGWVAYTLSRSTRQAAPDEPTKLFLYDQTHILNVLGSYQLGRGWELGGRFRYMTGFLYRACYGGIFNNSVGEYRCYGAQEQRRMAPFHQLDLRVEKTFNYSQFKWSAYLDVINAYYHSSPDYEVHNFDYSGVKPLSLSLPLLPSLGVRGEF